MAASSGPQIEELPLKVTDDNTTLTVDAAEVSVSSDKSTEMLAKESLAHVEMMSLDEVEKPLLTNKTKESLATRASNSLSDASAKLRHAASTVYNSTDLRTVSFAIAAGCAGAYQAPAGMVSGRLGGYYYHYMEDCIALAAAGVFDPKIMGLGVAGFTVLWKHGLHVRNLGQLWIVKEALSLIWTVAPTAWNVMRDFGRSVSTYFGPKEAAEAAEAAQDVAKAAANEMAKAASKGAAEEVVKQATKTVLNAGAEEVARGATTGLLNAAAEGVTKGVAQSIAQTVVAAGITYATQGALPIEAAETTQLLTNGAAATTGGIFAAAGYYAGSAIGMGYKSMNALNRFMFNRRRY